MKLNEILDFLSQCALHDIAVPHDLLFKIDDDDLEQKGTRYIAHAKMQHHQIPFEIISKSFLTKALYPKSLTPSEYYLKQQIEKCADELLSNDNKTDIITHTGKGGVLKFLESFLRDVFNDGSTESEHKIQQQMEHFNEMLLDGSYQIGGNDCNFLGYKYLG